MLEARVRWAEQELLDRDEELRIARARAADAESVAESAERAARAREAAWRAEEARLRHALGGLMDEVEERFSGGGGPPPRAGGRGERLLEGGYSYAGNGGGGNWYGGYGGCGNGGGGSGGGRNGYGGYGGYDGGGGSSYIGGGVELTAETADGRSLYNKAVIDEIRNRPTPPPPPPTSRFLTTLPPSLPLSHLPPSSSLNSFPLLLLHTSFHPAPTPHREMCRPHTQVFACPAVAVPLSPPPRSVHRPVVRAGLGAL